MTREIKPKVIRQTIALTWAPDPKLFKNINRPNMQLQAHFIHLRGLNRCANYELYPEFHLNGNLHYHLKVDIWDMIKWRRQTLPVLKMYGHVTIKPVTELAGWLTYIRKEKVTVQHTLKMNLPITQVNQPETNKAQYTIDQIAIAKECDFD